MAEADASNPAILALEARGRAAEHVPSQMRALPDPTTTVAYTHDSVSDFTLGDSTDASLTISFTQELPYPGKRRLAAEVARAEIGVRGQARETMRRRVRAQVKVEYAELFRLDRTLSIFQERRRLLTSFYETTRARYESGEGILENVLKAQTQLALLDGQVAALTQERRSAELRLGSQLGRSADTPFGPALAAPAAAIPEREPTERAALEQAPELLALRAQRDREETRLDLARRNLKPDFVWGTAYANRGDLDPLVTGMFGVRLPLYRKNKQAAAVAQSEYESQAAQRELESRRVGILAEVRDLLARAERAEVLLRSYHEAVLPQASSTLEAAAAAYRVGRTEFITLLDDFHAVLEYEVDHEMHRAERIQALAALEPLTGMDYVAPGVGRLE